MNPPKVRQILFVSLLLVIPATLPGCGIVLDGNYVFDTEILTTIVETITQQDNNLSLDEIFRRLVDALVDSYSDQINTDASWTLNEGDGLPGQVKVLYLSSNEYLVLVGSPSNTDWSFGPYQETEIWDFVLEGQVECYGENEFETTSYTAGQYIVLQEGTTKHYAIPNQAWLLEYGRGNFPPTFYNPDVEIPNILSEAIGLTSSIANEIIGELIREWFGLGPSLSF